MTPPKKKFDEKTVNRQDSGEFGIHKHTPGTMTLGFEATAVLVGKAAVASDYAEHMRSPNRAVARAAELALRAQIEIFAHGLGKGNTLNEDQTEDAISDIMLELYENAHKGRPVKRGLVYLVSKAIIGQRLGAPLRHEDVKALKQFLARVESEETRMGRPLTEKEMGQVAATIRDTWAMPRNKPTLEFYKKRPDQMVKDADTAELRDTESETRTIAPVTQRETTSIDVVENERVNRAIAGHEAAAAARNTAALKVRAQYTAYATVFEMPAPAQATVGAARASLLMSAARENVGGFARAYMDGYGLEANNEVLFAPFGDLQTGEKQALAMGLIGAQNKADALWLSAMSTAAMKPDRAPVKKPGAAFRGKPGRLPKAVVAPVASPWASYPALQPVT